MIVPPTSPVASSATSNATTYVNEARIFPAEDLPATQRAGEDHLEGSARVLVRDDVAGDERSRQLRAEARGEGEHDESERDARVPEVVTERHVVGPARLHRHDADEHDRQEGGGADSDIRALL
jgi:hypothetical protein